ncbi:hypothetical protein J6590_046633 [Homalodisca vitripennis]|nr:hypothetical protein J6590_046633 [Homalodisca vitripennis]
MRTSTKGNKVFDRLPVVTNNRKPKGREHILKCSKCQGRRDKADGRTVISLGPSRISRVFNTLHRVKCGLNLLKIPPCERKVLDEINCNVKDPHQVVRTVSNRLFLEVVFPSFPKGQKMAEK